METHTGEVWVCVEGGKYAMTTLANLAQGALSKLSFDLLHHQPNEYQVGYAEARDRRYHKMEMHISFNTDLPSRTERRKAEHLKKDQPKPVWFSANDPAARKR